MKSMHRRFLLAATLAGCALAAGAQTMQPPPAPGGGARPPMMMDREGHRGMDPARMREFMQRRIQHRLEELKIRLQLTPAQDGAWQQFAAAMQPPAQPQQHPDRQAFERMTTPERIDALRSMRNARNAEMDRRGDAAKAFYAQLNPSQRRVFDLESEHMLRPHRGGHRMGMGRGHEGRDGHEGGPGSEQR